MKMSYFNINRYIIQRRENHGDWRQYTQLIPQVQVRGMTGVTAFWTATLAYISKIRRNSKELKKCDPPKYEK